MEKQGNLDPVEKAEWVAALRSGKYEQTRGALRSGDDFCCLGVRCDLRKDYVGGKWKDNIFTFNDEISNEEDAALPIFLQFDLGSTVQIKLDSEDALKYGKDYVCLSELNDDGLTFNQIADIIEKYL